MMEINVTALEALEKRIQETIRDYQPEHPEPLLRMLDNSWRVIRNVIELEKEQ